MSETRNPRAVKSGMSCSISVVLPLPEKPANPNSFMSDRMSLEPSYRPLPAAQSACRLPPAASSLSMLLAMQCHQLRERMDGQVPRSLSGRRCAAAAPARAPVDPNGREPELLRRHMVVIEALRHVQYRLAGDAGLAQP